MKKLMGQKTTDKSNVQRLASKMNDFFVTVSEHLPRLDMNNEACDVDGQLPCEYVIDLTTTPQTLRKVETNKATGPDNVLWRVSVVVSTSVWHAAGRRFDSRTRHVSLLGVKTWLSTLDTVDP